jgi:hypothetical protein
MSELFLYSQDGNIEIKVFYSPTDAQVNCLKSNFKIDIKTAPTCFGSITVIFFFFFSSTTLYEFWLAQLFLFIVSSLAPSVSSSSLPSF